MNAAIPMQESVNPYAPAGTVGAEMAGLLRGELRKLLGLRITWVMTGIITLLILGSQLVLATGPTAGSALRHGPLDAFANALSGDIALVRIFSGVFILILAAHVVGLEYQYGTIRVLLGRGVGRLRLLGAKVMALALVGVALIALELLVEAICLAGIVLALAQGTRPWTTLTSEWWAELGVMALYLLLNLLVTLLLGVAAAVVGRSLAFGLAVGLSWFAVDNLLTIPLSILGRATGSNVWLKLSGVLLGPLLNRLPDMIAPAYHVTVAGPHGPVSVERQISGFGPPPLVSVPAQHALLVIAVYAVVFTATAIALTRRRDVLD